MISTTLSLSGLRFKRTFAPLNLPFSAFAIVYWSSCFLFFKKPVRFLMFVLRLSRRVIWLCFWELFFTFSIFSFCFCIYSSPGTFCWRCISAGWAFQSTGYFSDKIEDFCCTNCWLFWNAPRYLQQSRILFSSSGVLSVAIAAIWMVGSSKFSGSNPPNLNNNVKSSWVEVIAGHCFLSLMFFDC